MKSTFFSRRSFLILFIGVFLLPFAFSGARHALNSNKNDVAQWLPESYTETQIFNQFRTLFAGEQFVLVSWDGCTLHDNRLKLFASKLDPAPETGKPTEESKYFKDLLTGPEVIELLTSSPTDLSEKQAIERMTGTLIGPDGENTCAVLTLSPKGAESLRKSVEAIQRVAKEECNIPAEQLHMGGPPVDNVSIDIAGESSLFRLAGLSALIGFIVSWWCLRSGRLIAMVFSTAIVTAAASLAIVYYSGSTINAIWLTMPSLVYVAATSGAIHLSNYYRDTVKEEGVEGAPGRAVRHALLPISLATITTAVGLVSLCISELVPIQLFGMYSAIGVMLSFIVLLVLLPALFQLFPPKFEEARSKIASQAKKEIEKERRFSDPFSSPKWALVGKYIIRKQALVAIACLSVMGLCAYGTTQVKTSVQLMRLFDSKAKILADYKWLEDNLGELVPMEVILEIDQEKSGLTFLEQMELIARIQNRVNEIEEVGSSLSMVTFAPELDNTELPKRPYRGIKAAARATLNKRLSSNMEAFLASDYLRKVDNKLLWRVSARIGALKDVDYASFVSEIRKVVEPVLDEQRLFTQKNGNLHKAVAALPAADNPDAVAGEENPGDEKVVAANNDAPQEEQAEISFQEEDIALPEGVMENFGDSAIEKKQGVAAVYTGLVPLVYKAQNSLLNGLILGFIGDLIVVTIVMMISVREWSAGLILALPSIFPAVIIFGVMGLTGIVVDVGTVMTPAVALGVTVDDVVHFMLWYRQGLKQGLRRDQSIMLAYKGCARAMYQSWGVIGLGLSVFALSPFQPTQRFGYLMVTLLTASLAGNLLLLPALLASPIGALFGRGIIKQNERKRKLEEQLIHQASAPVSHLHEKSTDKSPDKPYTDTTRRTDPTHRG